MSTSLSARKGAIYGIISHLLIILCGQAIFILLLFRADLMQGLNTTFSLQSNPYAISFYVLLLAGGWVAGAHAAAKIVASPGRFLRTGVMYGLLVAVASLVYLFGAWCITSGWHAAVISIKEPSILIMVIFLPTWILLAKIMQVKACRG
ncbi:hypothetical protein [Chitinophaga sp.]|uniref:hypothetical protein n=1 Tax=Chitinophaga sp. TaxID=1869181 RepID=UPI002F937072